MRFPRRSEQTSIGGLSGNKPSGDGVSRTRVIAEVLGAIVGSVLGVGFAAATNQSMLFYGIIGIIVVGLAIAFFRLLGSGDSLQATLGAGAIIFALLAGACAGFIFTGIYTGEVQNTTDLQSAGAFLLGGGPVFGILFLVIDWYNDSVPSLSQRQSPVNPNYNYKGASVMRYKHLLAVGEQIELIERWPLVMLFLMNGIYLVPLLVLNWIYQRFPGVELIRQAYAQNRWDILCLVIAPPVALIVIWFVASLDYHTRLLASRSTSADESNKTVKRTSVSSKRVIVVVILAVAVIIWIGLGTPGLDWIRTQVENDPYNLLLLAMVPLAIQSLLVLLTWLTSYTILTNFNMICGMTLLFVPGTFSSRMPRSSMANSDKEGGLRRLLAYWILQKEGVGQKDRFWQKLAVRHGKQLELLLSTRNK